MTQPLGPDTPNPTSENPQPPRTQSWHQRLIEVISSPTNGSTAKITGVVLLIFGSLSLGVILGHPLSLLGFVLIPLSVWGGIEGWNWTQNHTASESI